MPDLASFGSGLVRYQVFTQYLRGLRHGFFGIAREFYTAGLAATTGLDLCLDNAAASELCRSGIHVVQGRCDLSNRHRNAVPFQNLFGLVFVDIHAISPQQNETLGLNY